MIRVLLTELIKTTCLLVVVSVLGFVALDATGQFDWWGTSELAMRAGIPRDRAFARDLPVVWNGHVADARVRTRDDLADLAAPTTRPAARERLIHRGTAALPTILYSLRHLSGETRSGALAILATLAPSITGGEQPPVDTDAALAYWDRFFALRGLDFRPAYAHRLVQRLVEHESRNAEEQLIRLGTFALPAVFDVLDQPVDTDAAIRLTALLSTITGLPLRVPTNPRVTQIREVVETWRAWWFVERLEYETLNDVTRVTGHVVETRYGRWLTRALVGTMGTSRVTGRPIALEVRQRTLRSLFVGGLGGLLAIAFVVAFGGGRELRKRPIGTKLLDLVGALVPGLGAAIFGFTLLVQLAAAPRPAGPLARVVFADPLRLAVAIAALAPIAALLLRRNYARVTLNAVRKEADSWARESRHPKPIQIVRHGARVGLASLLAPLALAALPLVAATHVVEPIVGVNGMGQLNVRSIMTYDPPWLLIALISVVPIWLAGHWSQRVMVWALGEASVTPKPPRETTAPAVREAQRAGNGAATGASEARIEPARASADR
jgi:ABC-type dipeptide/oligopeptide/nickel transport system permease component